VTPATTTTAAIAMSWAAATPIQECQSNMSLLGLCRCTHPVERSVLPSRVAGHGWVEAAEAARSPYPAARRGRR
jgi:hypothetical protein